MALIMLLFKVQAMLCRGAFRKKPRAPSTHQGEVNHINYTVSTVHQTLSVGTAAGITNKQE